MLRILNIARSSLPRIAAIRAISLPLLILGVATVGCQKVPLLAPTGSTMTLISSATSLPACRYLHKKISMK